MRGYLPVGVERDIGRPHDAMRCYNLESEIEVYFLMAVFIGAHDKVAAAQTIWTIKWVVSAAVDNVCVCVCVCVFVMTRLFANL